jgi:hypothetical protein
MRVGVTRSKKQKFWREAGVVPTWLLACRTRRFVRAAVVTGRGGALVDRGHAAAAGLALKQGVPIRLRENTTGRGASTWLRGLLSRVIRFGLLFGYSLRTGEPLDPP